ncbi:trypsin-like serine peptidase [Nocardioides antri]|uniref:Trypsin-like serine protease n=1 Tax=Nocardioides antri TaxID=2607659 RepID=A0A5B1MC15_9ACTN|nr:hypothetical protein [Nocardioides antri]KAA1429170.1 hypothetical protein F0U47_02970 [Nocardioides antri]
MGLGRRVAVLAVGVLVSGTLSVATTTADAGAPTRKAATASSDDGAVLAAPAADATAREVRRYWTVERMAEAIPLDLLGPGGVVDTASDPATETTAAKTAGRVRVPRTTGKLFFSDAGGNYVCSAATIRTRRRDQVITAGHCVHTGPDVGLLAQPHFYRNFLFVPRYRHGRAPLGRWAGRNAWVFKGWAENGATRFDQAIIAFKRRDGRKLVNHVGGNEVVWGKRAKQRGVRIWGWPAQAPYDGETARRCDGRTTRSDAYADRGGDAVMHRCNLTGGASGGPWFLPKDRTRNTGRIFAVTSRRDLVRPNLIAHPITRDIRRMIRTANGR